MKYFYGLITIALLSALLCGCGETINGIGRDASRIWYGTKTIFISDSQ